MNNCLFLRLFYGIIIILPATIYVIIFISYSLSLKRKINSAIGLFNDIDVIKWLRVKYNIKPSGGEYETNTFTDFDNKELFRKIYFSKRDFIFPLIILSFITALVSFTIFLKLDIGQISVFPAFCNKMKNMPYEVIYAFIGCYVWGLYDILIRIKNIDLTPDSIHLIWLKFLIIATLGYIMSKVFKDLSTTYLIVFSMAVLPLVEIKQILVNYLNKKFGRKESNFSDNGLNNIDKISKEHIDRFYEEGIYNYENLAFSDPLSLYFKTNIEWKVILDLIDQSLLFCYVFDNIGFYRKAGIRGAIEASTLLDIFEEDVQNNDSRSVIGYLSDSSQVGFACTVNLLSNIRDDKHVNYIWELWDRTVRNDIRQIKDGSS